MILASGAFDGLHSGHVAYLDAAKSLCEAEEILLCAVAPDRYIAEAKGRTPRWSQHDRLCTVTAVGVVDAAVAQAECSVAGIIRQYRPRVLVKGVDWQARLPEDVLQACDETGTAIAYVDTPGTHVSETKLTDEQALAQLEALVLSQQPASVPWAPVTDYSFEARQAIEGQHPQVLIATFQPQRVLDVGCGPGHLMTLLEALGVTCRGLDVAANPKWTVDDRIWQHDICRERGPDWVDDLERDYLTADLVICREVLEHLTIRQIRQAIPNLCRLSSRFVYVTTRFARAPTHLLSVDTADDLDPTHITMLTQPFLRVLFVLEGFRRRADLETRMDWQQKGRCLVYERV